MKKTLREYDLALTLRGPVLTKSSNPATFGLDAVVARDFLTDAPMLPGTLVEGRVREALDQLGFAGRLDDLFGRETDANSSNEPAGGRLLIGDLVAAPGSRAGKPITRVALDHALGSARGEMLRVLESPYAPGETVEFKGKAHVFADDAEAAEIRKLLHMGLCWPVQFGACRTTGFGRTESASVRLLPEAPLPELVQFGPAHRALDLEIRPRGPLCVSRHKIGNNLFESDTVIPGNMLAGAIMRTAKELGLDQGLKDAGFDSIRFRHAFPTTGTSRPRPLPASTVKAHRTAYDIADFPDPVLLGGDGRWVAPEFPVDWKDSGAELEKLGWASPAREMRVRTAIDSTRRTAYRGSNGEGGKLFAWEMVHPVLPDRTTPVVWRSRIDLDALNDAQRQKAARLLAIVLARLSFVSKTKARCDVTVAAAEAQVVEHPLAAGSVLKLVLRTPALLVDPRFQGVGGGALSPAQMLALQRAVWSELSEGSLELLHQFSRQFLAGGNHLAIRFQMSGNYDPWLLTDAGAVFVFKVSDSATATEKLRNWLATGLPLPKWAIGRFGNTWKTNPYLLQNGFGEVAVHAPEFAVPSTRPVVLADSLHS